VERLLLGQGHVVALTPKGFDLLFALVRNAGRVVNKEQLMAEVWPDTFVEENNLTVTISALRKALGEPRSEQRYIQTVPRRGYRFAASVRRSGESSPPAPYRHPAAEADSEILVGREPELRKLETWLCQAIEGAGRIIFITGEPGIGKTALSNAFFNRARLRFPAARFCRGRCLEQYGAGEPYLPILEALSELLSGTDGEFVADVLRSRAPTWCLQFPAVFGSNGAMERLYRETVGATKERMLREMVDALGALASAGPVVLHIEDLHWVDHSSIDLLGRLSQNAREQRLLVTGTFRQEDVERANHPFKNFLLEMQTHSQCEELALGMLSREHLANYLDARFVPHRFDPELPALIHRRTEGQPLFATSLVQFLVERNDFVNVNEEWILTRRLSELGMEAPGNVRKLIRKKIEALDAEDRRALEFASVQGEVFTSAVLAGLLEVDDLALEERLDRLDKVHRLIQTMEEDDLPDGTLTTRYRFAHVLYQNSLYSDLVNKRRVLLHHQAGDLMIRFYGDQAPRLAAQLAVHFERGRDFGRAVEYLVHAGDNGRQINANDKAVEHYSRALSLVSRLPLENQAPSLLTIYQKRGAAHLAMGQFDQAVEDFTNWLYHARATSNRRSEHSALKSLAEVFFYSHRLDELDDCAGEAVRIAKDLGDDRLRVEAMVFIAMRQDIVGELAEAKRNLDEIIHIARNLDDKRALLDALAWRGQLHFFQSEYERAREVLLEALDLASALRHGPLLLQAQFFLGLSLGNMGRISESLAMLEEVSSMARRNGDQYWHAKVPNCIAWIHRELQDFDHALKRDLEGLEVARSSKVSEAETNSLISLGHDRIHTAESGKALKSFGDAEAILESDVWCRWRFTLRLYEGLSRHHLADEKLDEAAGYAKLLLESATRYGARKYAGVAHKLLADVAIARSNLDDAETELRAALDTLAAHPVPLVEWKIYSALGRLRLRMNDGSSAEAFENASGIVEMIATNIEDETLRRSFLGAPAVQDVFVRRIAGERQIVNR
jgi:DNA-binding winged helix-turn-helix (wHTH) protein/tetratricopeptide (TPR) repeat protein